MEWWNLGVGSAGLAASIVGLIFALFALLAATSAKKAANEAHNAVTRSLSLMDVERAVGLISRLKEVHRRGNWEYAIGLYQDLRRTLSEIRSSIPPSWSESRNDISGAIPQVTALENLVGRSFYENENGEPGDIPRLDETLSDIQQSLESLQSHIVYEREATSS